MSPVFKILGIWKKLVFARKAPEILYRQCVVCFFKPMIKPARPKLRNKNRGIWTKLLGSKTNNEKKAFSHYQSGEKLIKNRVIPTKIIYFKIDTNDLKC